MCAGAGDGRKGVTGVEPHLVGARADAGCSGSKAEEILNHGSVVDDGGHGNGDRPQRQRNSREGTEIALASCGRGRIWRKPTD